MCFERWSPRCFLLASLAAFSACDGDSGLFVDVMYPKSGLGDRSYADSVYAGLVAASLDTRFTVASASPADPSAGMSVFTSWVSAPTRGRELILMVGTDRGPIVDAAACSFGGRQVVQLDARLRPCPGLKSVVYDVFPPSFLAGVAAMTVSSSQRAAVIGGRSDSAVDRFVRGFLAGVRSVGGTVTAVEYLATDESGFADPARAGTVAARLYRDVDVIFPVAGASAAGVFEAAGTAPGRYAFGVDSDQSWLAPAVIIGSVAKGLDRSVLDAIHQEAAGRFAGGNVVEGMASGAVALVVNEAFTDRVQAAVDGARSAALAAGVADLKENPW